MSTNTTCPACIGSGGHYERIYDEFNPDGYDEHIECSKCLGSGLTQRAEDRALNEQISRRAAEENAMMLDKTAEEVGEMLRLTKRALEGDDPTDWTLVQELQERLRDLHERLDPGAYV